MKNRSFKNKSTWSIGKIKSEMLFDLWFAWHIVRALKVNPNLTVHVLVGSTRGLKRHVDRCLKLGFKMECIYIHEIVPELADSLRKACKRRGYTCQVVTGDAIKNIRSLLENGLKILYIEFDGTKSYGTFGFDLFKLARRYKIKCLLYEGATWKQSQNLKNWAKKNSVRKTPCPFYGYPRYELAKVTDLIAKKEMRGYESLYTTYQGLCGMFAHAFIAK